MLTSYIRHCSLPIGAWRARRTYQIPWQGLHFKYPFPTAEGSPWRASAPPLALRPAKHKEGAGAQVDVLITVSGFTMMPSHCTAVAARFGMRSDLDAYHLGGHGCVGSTLAICLARQLLLAVRPAGRLAAHNVPFVK